MNCALSLPKPFCFLREHFNENSVLPPDPNIGLTELTLLQSLLQSSVLYYVVLLQRWQWVEGGLTQLLDGYA